MSTWISLPTLVWLGNLACLEFHPSCEWIGTAFLPGGMDHRHRSATGGRARLMEAVSLVGEALDSLGIASVPKTSGATGVQIYVPIREGYTFGSLLDAGRIYRDVPDSKNTQTCSQWNE